jgi:hypothetical protein
MLDIDRSGDGPGEISPVEGGNDATSCRLTQPTAKEDVGDALLRGE